MTKARDVIVAAKDEATESVVEANEQVKILHQELRDTHQQLGEAIKVGRQLREQLSITYDELVVAHLAIKEVKGAYEEETNQASK